MQGKYILLALIVILLIVPQAEASTKKIVEGSPVFVGETDLDISSALDNCRIIAWWPDGADTTQPAGKNITLRALNEMSSVVNHYTISPEEFANYTGTWYCEEKKPLRPVFVVTEPQVTIRAWDLDTGTDVSGTTVPAGANVTCRIETNLVSALQLKYRPDLTPADSFWTMKLIDPLGRSVTNIYTGSYGAPGTVILTFERSPRITTSPYQWRDGEVWDHSARNLQGEPVYPPGKYTFTVSQNLNGMESSYNSAGITDVDGLLSSSADFTLVQASPVSSTPTQISPVPTGTVTGTPDTPESMISPTTPLPVTTIPVKTTYQPLPEWIALAGLGIAAAFAAWQRR